MTNIKLDPFSPYPLFTVSTVHLIHCSPPIRIKATPLHCRIKSVKAQPFLQPHVCHGRSCVEPAFDLNEQHPIEAQTFDQPSSTLSVGDAIHSAISWLFQSGLPN
ncbi:MAG: hypothetical protein P8M80_16280, partial [Pirellulaceae bacterium]|nr:hypothetical protein [Pirellulaceae bacterium]